MAVCEQCGKRFSRAPGETWKRLCLGCWFERKNARECERCANLENEIERLEAQLAAVRDYIFDVLGGFRQFWPFLLRRAHPDHNGGSKEATDVTRWLLELRDATKNLPGGVDGSHRVQN